MNEKDESTHQNNETPQTQKSSQSPKNDIVEVYRKLLDVFRDDEDGEEKKKIASQAISGYITETINSDPIANIYNIIIHYDNTTLLKTDADDIYTAVTKFTERKPILMILQSYGGEIGAAYLIGKLCREYSDGKFIVVIPRMAKSAATLLSCAADEIHMGSMSELGPIDPQIKDMPVLGLKNSIEHISQLVSQNPNSSEMFAKYLIETVKPIDIGYNERVAESAMQYAERLLSTHKNNLVNSPAEIARNLVYTYKDHGFVIDKSEATDIFGNNLIKINTNEYKLSNRVYGYLKSFKEICSAFNCSFVYIGTKEEGVKLIKRKKE
ncbi:MAG: hypothetical protein WCS69_16175 [Ignavibacteriaceae bacterium]